MNREEKAVVVDSLKGEFAKAKAAYLTSFTGLTVMSVDDLRKKVRLAGGHYRVIKNTLARLSTKGTPFEEISKGLKGPVGWAYTEKDPVNLAKVLKKFRDDNELFAYQGGMLEGQKIDRQAIEALSEMPAKEVLLAQILGLLHGPARSLATVIQAVPRQLVTVIDAIRKKKEEETKNV